MLIPPTAPGAGHGVSLVFKDFPVQNQGTDFADGFRAGTWAGLEELEAALLFSNCFDST